MTDNIIALEEEQWTVERLKALADQREKLEKEIKALRDYLLAPGNPGLKGGLVDKDGFPVCDFEKAYSVREARQQLAMKTNDLKVLMKRIEVGLVEVHRIYREEKERQANQAQTGT